MRNARPRIAMLVLSGACLTGATAPPAAAAGLRECTSVGSWAFGQPLTTATISGTAWLDTTTTCLRYTAGGGFTTHTYPSFIDVAYQGNCVAMRLSRGSTVVGAMAGEQVITTHAVGGILSSAVHVVLDHPVCSGATTLDTVFHWVHLEP